MASATPAQTPARASLQHRAFDYRLLVPIAAVFYALIGYPLIQASCDIGDAACVRDRFESKLVWPTLAAFAVGLALINFNRLAFPRHLVWLAAYLSLAGVSVLWAYHPGLSSIRFSQQCMVLAAVVLPCLIADRRADLMRGLFLCFALSVLINIPFVMKPPPVQIETATPGHPGYFLTKNYLGLTAAIAGLLALHELFVPGRRRLMGLLMAPAAVVLVVYSNSKTALALLVVSPLLAWLMVIARRQIRLSPAVVPLAMIVAWIVMAYGLNFSIYRISYIFFGESTFTGRKLIWEFALSEISVRSLLGWGYQSFWLVGPDAPSIVNAPGWVKTMPNAHNGYLDVMLELGYVGLALMMMFLVTTLTAIGRLIDVDRVHGWIALTLTFFVLITSLLESFLARAFEVYWLVLVLVAADVGRRLLAEVPPVSGRQALRTRTGPTHRHPTTAGLAGRMAGRSKGS